MDEAIRMMDLAARAASRGAGHVEPNPMVGAVIVRSGRIIGIGHHRRFGGPHAEREAIQDCLRRGADPRGSTIYVTLEPCSHWGKQPPCVDALLEAGISRVVMARRDPNPVSGGGLEKLAAAGVAVETCEGSVAATQLSAPFIRRITSGLPWVIAKWAQTIDGRIATRTGESKWISGERSRARVHRLRSRVDAILTGVGTVLADDPLMTARRANGDPRKVRRVARRIVADTDLDLPLDTALVRSARSVPVLIACAKELATAAITADRRAKLEAAGVEIAGVRAGAVGVDLEELLRLLVSRFDVTNVLVEAGPGLLGSLMEAGLVDEAIVYVAPMLLGDELARSVATGRVAESLSAGRRFVLWRVRRLGNDVELTYRRRPGD
ncbi:MAG: bifunctional diaminohydroxyphosphoribosylaminopyrimidine deaminase/5-amino-6-(5-phosphoribosylamino)uracil reductase RibD [Phycisphaerales bacterium]|nr:bifunctional diaminohydroxyphosphoribosylaminopyrimidine deaminase/5-amino-6-(5-phosphoribosylamino)uracil reductase RibD [Phycisphaerales bacterium]